MVGISALEAAVLWTDVRVFIGFFKKLIYEKTAKTALPLLTWISKTLEMIWT